MKRNMFLSMILVVLILLCNLVIVFAATRVESAGAGSYPIYKNRSNGAITNDFGLGVAQVIGSTIWTLDLSDGSSISVYMTGLQSIKITHTNYNMSNMPNYYGVFSAGPNRQERIAKFEEDVRNSKSEYTIYEDNNLASKSTDYGNPNSQAPLVIIAMNGGSCDEMNIYLGDKRQTEIARIKCIGVKKIIYTIAFNRMGSEQVPWKAYMKIFSND